LSHTVWDASASALTVIFKTPTTQDMYVKTQQTQTLRNNDSDWKTHQEQKE